MIRVKRVHSPAHAKATIYTGVPVNGPKPFRVINKTDLVLDKTGLVQTGLGGKKIEPIKSVWVGL